MGRYAPIDASAPPLITLDDFFTPEACARVIRDAEARGFEVASIAYRAGTRVDPAARNNARVTFEDESLRTELFERAAPHLPSLHGERPAGLNERLRVYRYEPGQRFTTHRDGWVQRPDGSRSRLTSMIYLSEVEAGGETWFPSLDRGITPRTGRAVFFQHSLLHASRPVIRGTKYVLRSDVYYV